MNFKQIARSVWVMLPCIFPAVAGSAAAQAQVNVNQFTITTVNGDVLAHVHGNTRMLPVPKLASIVQYSLAGHYALSCGIAADTAFHLDIAVNSTPKTSYATITAVLSRDGKVVKTASSKIVDPSDTTRTVFQNDVADIAGELLAPDSGHPHGLGTCG